MKNNYCFGGILALKSSLIWAIPQIVHFFRFSPEIVSASIVEFARMIHRNTSEHYLAIGSSVDKINLANARELSAQFLQKATQKNLSVAFFYVSTEQIYLITS